MAGPVGDAPVGAEPPLPTDRDGRWAACVQGGCPLDVEEVYLARTLLKHAAPRTDPKPYLVRAIHNEVSTRHRAQTRRQLVPISAGSPRASFPCGSRTRGGDCARTFSLAVPGDLCGSRSGVEEHDATCDSPIGGVSDDFFDTVVEDLLGGARPCPNSHQLEWS